jgi:predicted CxxxxCH...CXXCH cytochrome family protein
LSGGASSRPLACAECHEVPEQVDDFAHADGLPAEVALLGVAETGAREPRWQRSDATCVDSWCHGPATNRANPSPPWTGASELSCASCHESPPPAPHPQMSNCSHCHGDVVAEDDVTMRDRSRHVDGVVDAFVDQSCTGCHGSENPAPPFNLAGEMASSAPGVGAHQTHVLGTPRSRAVPCGECHEVPSEVLSPGHVDTPLPAEVSFTGVALAFGATPTLVNDTCSNTSCHGAVFHGGHASGGSLTAPKWHQVDGTQAACGTCHGLPPPRPHPYYSEDCGRCHKNMSPDGSTFLHPELHVDGSVTFEVE